jgi:uncharacterized membrane protein YhaH (DUF805 family)
VSFPESIKHVLTNYASGQGRAGRSEFWWFTLFVVLVCFAGSLLDAVLGTSFIAVIAFLALFVPSVAVTVRRLHDTNRSGWWYLLSFIPLIGGIVLLVFCLQNSKAGSNEYGAAPAMAVA